jgi:hypothetical protein
MKLLYEYSFYSSIHFRHLSHASLNSFHVSGLFLTAPPAWRRRLLISAHQTFLPNFPPPFSFPKFEYHLFNPQIIRWKPGGLLAFSSWVHFLGRSTKLCFGTWFLFFYIFPTYWTGHLVREYFYRSRRTSAALYYPRSPFRVNTNTWCRKFSRSRQHLTTALLCPRKSHHYLI